MGRSTVCGRARPRPNPIIRDICDRCRKPIPIDKRTGRAKEGE